MWFAGHQKNSCLTFYTRFFRFYNLRIVSLQSSTREKSLRGEKCRFSRGFCAKLLKRDLNLYNKETPQAQALNPDRHSELLLGC